MIIHLVDGTYELFRHFYGLRRFSKTDPPFGAVSGVLHTVVEGDNVIALANQFLTNPPATQVTFGGYTATSINYVGPTVTYNLTGAQRNLAVALKTALDRYNNGLGCP